MKPEQVKIALGEMIKAGQPVFLWGSAGIGKSAASSRYIRAVMRLKKELAGVPGFFDA